MTPGRFGCIVLQDRPIDELRADWRAIEDAGLDSLWIADHLMSFPKMGPLLEAWTTLAAMAVTTTQIRIGTLVTNITYRHPALLAKEIITVDHLSGGRLEIGLGAAGTRADDARVAGRDEWTPSERTSRFGEFVEMLDRLLTGADTFDGDHYRSAGFATGDWPVQTPRPPMTIAAQGRKTLKIAARFADTWNGMAGFGRKGAELLAFLRSCNESIDAFAVEAGRRPADIRRSILVADGGIDWWESVGAFDDYVGTMNEAGIEDFFFYYPPYGEAAGHIDRGAFLDLVASARESV